MKQIFIYIFLFSSVICLAQNYNVVQLNKKHFFFNQTNNQIQGIRIDSVSVSGSDSIFYNYSVLDYQPDSNGCYNVFGPSWLGRKIIKRSDSLTIILNNNNDSLYLRPLDAIGSTWMYDLATTATVTSITPTNINGIPDSIKTIVLANGSTIKLSRENGFYKIFSFRDFPHDTSSYYLNDQLAMTFDNVYNFDVNDTFQFDRYIIPGFSSPGYVPTHHFDIIIVLSKNVSSNGDTISYNYLKQSVDTIVVHDSLGAHVISTITNHFTSDVFTTSSNAMLNKMPDEIEVLNGTALQNYSYTNINLSCNGETIKGYSGNYYFDTTYNCFLEGFEPTTIDETYGKGLGFTSYNMWGCNLCGNSSFIYEMTSYRKANSSCGNIILVNTTQEINADNFNIKIYPNPVGLADYLYIEKDTSEKSFFELFDLSGKLILSSQLNDIYSSINIKDITPGFYFYKATFNGNKILTGKIVK